MAYHHPKDPHLLGCVAAGGPSGRAWPNGQCGAVLPDRRGVLVTLLIALAAYGSNGLQPVRIGIETTMKRPYAGLAAC